MTFFNSAQASSLVDWLPLIFSGMAAIVPSSLIAWVLKGQTSIITAINKQDIKVAVAEDNIEDLEAKVERLHHRSHDLINKLHAIELALAAKKNT